MNNRYLGVFYALISGLAFLAFLVILVYLLRVEFDMALFSEFPRFPIFRVVYCGPLLILVGIANWRQKKYAFIKGLGLLYLLMGVFWITFMILGLQMK